MSTFAPHVLMPAQCPDDVIAAVVAAMPQLSAEHVATVYAKLVRAAGVALKDSSPVLPGEPVEFSDPLGAFLREVYDEAHRAAALFPGDTLRTLAFAEEAGELVKAVLDESPERVRREAVQTAAMAARIVLDGDGSVVEWRKAKGAAPLGVAPVRVATLRGVAPELPMARYACTKCGASGANRGRPTRCHGCGLDTMEPV